jgi:excisionase family DNA binding protein
MKNDFEKCTSKIVLFYRTFVYFIFKEALLMETYLKATDVAQLVKLSLVTIRRYTAANKIPCYRINRAVRYKKSEIQEWVEKNGATTFENQNDKN